MCISNLAQSAKHSCTKISRILTQAPDIRPHYDLWLTLVTMDPFSICIAVAPLVISSAKLIMLISAVRDSYNSAPITLTATMTECKIIHITLSKIQGLVYKNENDLSSSLTAQVTLQEAFDDALTGCRMTLAALNLELEKLAEPKKPKNELDIGFKAKARLVWKEDIMKQLLDQTRAQMLSLRCLVQVLESETQADMFRLLKENTADLRKILHRAKSIRSYQGVDDDQSSFHFTYQSASYGFVPSYEAQLAQSSTYQRAQSAAAEELLARKIELLDEKYALEEKVENLLLDFDTNNEKLIRLENDALLKDEKLARLENYVLVKENDAFLKDEKVARLEKEALWKDKKFALLETDALLKDKKVTRLEAKNKRLLVFETKFLKLGEEIMQNAKLKSMEELNDWEGNLTRWFEENGNPRALNES